VRRSELSGPRDQARWHGPHSRSSEAAPGDQPAEAADELKPGASLTAKLSKEEHHVRRKKTNPSDLRKIAQDLIKSGKMPTPERFLQANVPKLKKLREKEKVRIPGHREGGVALTVHFTVPAC
jgi:hypothetical protein